MPTEAKHLSQYSKNKELLSLREFNITTTKYLDWVITIVFYSAIHLVEKELAKMCYHSKSHEKREIAITKHHCLKMIHTEYHSLYMASIKARYDCHSYKEKDAHVFFNHLNKIEKLLKVI
ncbi:MAG: hypothetical protein PHS52_03750 [Desulfotomaculaceae bacterium]|nr:hypothetical protein [Desulfotomaculaceae bacterium]